MVTGRLSTSCGLPTGFTADLEKTYHGTVVSRYFVEEAEFDMALLKGASGLSNQSDVPGQRYGCRVKEAALC